MPTLQELTAQLSGGADLSAEQAAAAAHGLAAADTPADDKRAFLLALAAKGETAAEVAAIARVFRGLARDPGLAAWAPRAIDVVGTGGDGFGSFNISSVSALTVAAAGTPVIKHGNRAITSKSGAADFMALLGIPQEPPPGLLAESMDQLNFCFLFAPSFHPAFKEIMPVRKALAAEGKRTIFNILGPLINPAHPRYELLGVYSKQWVKPLADALHALRLHRGLAVHAEFADGKGVDEMSCAGRNRIVGFGDFSGLDTVWLPKDLGLAECEPATLKGGTAAENFETLQRIVAGEGPRGLTDTIILNAGTAIWIAGNATDVKDGISQAREALLRGPVKEWLVKARQFYSRH